jgi:hypothetical protein
MSVAGFPNLRHNIFVYNGGVANVTSSTSDTGDSFFIYPSNEKPKSYVYGLDAPVFVPVLASSETIKLQTDSSHTTFTLKGKEFYPCGMEFNVFRGSINDQIQVFLFRVFL